MCKHDFCFKTTLVNLEKHIERKHPLVKLKEDTRVADGESSSMDAVKEVSPPKIVQSTVSMFLRKKNGSQYFLLATTKKTVTNTLLLAAYEEAYNNTKMRVSKLKSVTLITDCWTACNAESFLGITVHYVDANFEVKSLLLDCVSFLKAHTSQNLASEIKQIIEK
ncbi:hypothetical protein ILUMI_01532 [Ignelater luminosus]|uniref:Transposase n=1 Tax=Ignelater luminosus TaxID=2038154 RepID=A0A8K0GP49_IGNLU|nr:hypothetical protein ILUMI_01532 [Ignelater luminosus]